ncbi:hypothetical protein B0181_11390 [Moraxella caviae]|uniref:Uncharacterized protein n=1 Tax=Moraxella caviae TaxID=34060 RepID=A0A1S9ZU60_9GAMM|nr:hypothetical protein [Moraxella caviae]OOR87019.1 hypothetical protein B0181_11390 [Moraxella caviae]
MRALLGVAPPFWLTLLFLVSVAISMYGENTHQALLEESAETLMYYCLVATSILYARHSDFNPCAHKACQHYQDCNDKPSYR